jgi:hypothetical protein
MKCTHRNNQMGSGINENEIKRFTLKSDSLKRLKDTATNLYLFYILLQTSSTMFA